MPPLSEAVRAFLLFVACRLTAIYLNLQPELVFSIAMAIGLLALSNYMRLRKTICALVDQSVPMRVSVSLFSIFFSISIVMGKHVQLTGSTYGGTASENYIDPYGPKDIAALLVLAALCLYLLCCLLTVLAPMRGEKVNQKREIDLACRVFDKCELLYAACLLVLWMPWLLAYWPGFVFSDTLSSFAQIQGTAALSNHHPIFFTGLIGAGIRIAHSLGLSSTAGVGIFTSFQMIFQALCYSYLFAWMRKRLGVPKIYICLAISMFGLSPYFASFSIALWKDPIFSSALIAISILLAEIVLRIKHGDKHVGAFRYLMLAALMVVASLIRNNGPIIVAAVAICSFVYGLFNKRLLKQLIVVSSLSVGVVALCLVVTGPVYKNMGVVPTEKVESLGVPLNQMARVAALNGDMSDSDRDYMNSVLPLEQYSYKYRPTCTDLLKWDPEFNPKPLENDFWLHWLSMLIRNPRVYFEAWELQTFGFWTVNVPAVNSYDNNIGGGVPRLSDEEVSPGIRPHSLFGLSALRDYLPYEQQFISCGVLFWLYLLAFIIACWLGWDWAAFSIIPVGAMYVSLLIASPIWYWSRYGIAAQMLISYLLALIWRAYAMSSADDVSRRFDSSSGL